MKDRYVNLNPNELVKFLDKPANQFQRDDIIKFIEEHEIEMLNFRYIAEDGKLKTLNFIIHSREHLEQILTYGERVDGSSLFSFISAGSSDLYVIPRFRTAFVNPFSEMPSLDILCSFYTSDGEPLENSPEYILKKAQKLFQDKTGLTFKALGELEYYINSPRDTLFPTEDQKGYHASAPFAKWEHLRLEAMSLIARAGGRIKYGHNEVGNFRNDSEDFEQHEIEFLPMDVEEAADQLVIAKWILRMLADRYGIELSFAPKITVGKAGSGLHIHLLAEKSYQNVMEAEGRLSDTARKMIAGILSISDALTAFGNTIPTSYLRLVPNQEAPTSICWGDRNRSVLIRVPLGWLGDNDMIYHANPGEKTAQIRTPGKQTVEFRAPDGSANIHNLLAGLVIGALKGLENKDSLDLAEKLYANEDIHKDPKKMAAFHQLPDSCHASALALKAKRKIFEEDGIFPERMIDKIIEKLLSYKDENLSEKLYGNTEEIRKLVLKYIHVM
ncbi:MAG: glutamine synthetase family protein [Bacteroidales bacterium]